MALKTKSFSSCAFYPFITLSTNLSDEPKFPAHRNSNVNNTDANISLTNWWGTTIIGYANNQSNLFHCPVLTGKRVDRGVKWEWKFDCHEVGYGYNGYFLGCHPYPSTTLSVGGITFLSSEFFKRSSVVSPAENLLIGDKQPYGNPPNWASSLWWPNSDMNPGGSVWEGIDAQRHLGASAIVLNDGHSEVRKNDQINPPANPGNGGATALKNSRYWDPLQHSQL